MPLVTIIGLRIKDLAEPYVPSVQGDCKHCGEKLWADVKIKNQLENHDFICMECLRKKES